MTKKSKELVAFRHGHWIRRFGACPNLAEAKACVASRRVGVGAGVDNAEI
jgi:hypothetical protein